MAALEGGVDGTANNGPRGAFETLANLRVGDAKL